MEDAVRGLVHEGVPRERIRVSKAARTDRGIQTPPKQRAGVGLGAVVGGLVGVVLALSTSASFVIIAAGALFGALLALVAYRPERVRYEAYRDFFVRVYAEDERAATSIRAALSRAGGQLVAT